MRTLAAILVITLPAGWAAFAATDSGTDHKTAPKTGVKKTPGTKAPAAKAPTGKVSINKTSTGKTAPTAAASKTGASNTKQTASKTGTKTGMKTGATSTTNTRQQASTRSRRSTQLAPSADRYKEIQQALADRGYFGGTADGSWGPTSVDALKRFQHDQSLIEDGKIGSLSLIALGLGPKRVGTSVMAAPVHEHEAIVDPEVRGDAPLAEPPPADPQ